MISTLSQSQKNAVDSALIRMYMIPTCKYTRGRSYDNEYVQELIKAFPKANCQTTDIYSATDSIFTTFTENLKKKIIRQYVSDNDLEWSKDVIKGYLSNDANSEDEDIDSDKEVDNEYVHEIVTHMQIIEQIWGDKNLGSFDTDAEDNESYYQDVLEWWDYLKDKIQWENRKNTNR